MLVHHPDAQRNGIVGRVDRHILAADQDLALIRFVQAVQDVHQRRLPGAVFAEQSVDLSLLQRQIDVIVGQHSGECLRDASKLQYGRHRRISWSVASLMPGKSVPVPAMFQPMRRGAGEWQVRKGPGVPPALSVARARSEELLAQDAIDGQRPVDQRCLGGRDLGLQVGRNLAVKIVERREIDAAVSDGIGHRAAGELAVHARP